MCLIHILVDSLEIEIKKHVIIENWFLLKFVLSQVSPIYYILKTHSFISTLKIQLD